MEFYVKSDNEQTSFIGEGLIIKNDEKETLESLIANMVYGCGLVIASVIQKRTDNHDVQKKLADLSIRMLQDAVNGYLERECEQTLYDKMVEMYDEWFENECSYEDEGELIEDIREYRVMPCMMYNDDEDTIEVCLEPDDEHFFCSFSELLGSMPADLFEDNQTRAEATVLAFELIATVLFDKCYGEDDNPLRADDFIHLDKQLPSFFETL